MEKFYRYLFLLLKKACEMKYYDPVTDCSADSIKHKGKVTGSNEHNYFISIITESACSACSVQGACNVSRMQNETLEIPKGAQTDYHTGDEVNVIMEKSLGPKAVLLGYIFPFLILFATLIISLNLLKDEGIAGLISVMIVIPYYLLLYLFRHKLKKTFVFRIM
jgi:sigma-E factor negative regulatory protein RseC